MGESLNLNLEYLKMRGSYDERKTYFLDTHTVKFFSGIATPEQVHAGLRILANRADAILGRTPVYRVNIVYDRRGVSMGWGYIYTRDTEYYYLLIGRSANGVQRYTEVESLSETCTTKHIAALTLLCGTPYTPIPLCQGDDLSTRVQKAVRVLPIDDLFEYTTAQRTSIIERYGTCPTHGQMVFEPALSKPVGNHARHNVLISGTCIPSWCTFDQLHTIFDYYNHSTKEVVAPVYQKRGSKYVQVGTRTGAYPIIRLDSNQRILVEYDPELTDGMFALLMSIKIYENSSGGSRWIIFNYAPKEGA